MSSYYRTLFHTYFDHKKKRYVMLAGVRVVSSISISSMSLKRELVLDAASRKKIAKMFRKVLAVED
jgi:hypothetical protein